MDKDKQVDTSSPEVLVSDARHALKAALHAIDGDDIPTLAWAVEQAESKLEELADALGVDDVE